MLDVCCKYCFERLHGDQDWGRCDNAACPLILKFPGRSARCPACGSSQVVGGVNVTRLECDDCGRNNLRHELLQGFAAAGV